ncbi:MAG: IS110 family transposase [Thermodesulfovibrionales bacterium]|nr:IS110 family transposase [Thermodesulfovibrionales bacterium]
MNRAAVGIDVSKKTLDVALTVDGKEVISSGQFANDAKGHKALLKWVGKQTRKHGVEETHYTMEATGVYSEDLHEFLSEAGEPVSVENPIKVKSFSQMQMMRTKTDAVDAAVIARYAWITKPALTPPAEPSVKRLRTLVRHVEHLTGRRAQEANRLEGAKDKLVIKSIKAIVIRYDHEIEKTMEEINKHVDSNPDLKKKRDLLTSIPGIGEKLSSQILCEIKSNAVSVKAQVAHAGLAPRQRVSGTSVRGKTQICKMGNARLRRALYMPTMSAIQYNPHIREFYLKKVSQGKHKMVALCACMRKLLVIALGVLKNGVPYQEDWVSRRPVG